MNDLVQQNNDEAMGLPVVATTSAALILDETSMARMERLATLMATGRATVPKHLRGNVGDCLAIVMQSIQWKMNPYAVASKTHFVNDNIGYEAQLVNAVINTMAPTQDRIHYEWFGEWERVIGKFKEIESRNKKDDNGHPVKYRVPDWNLKDEEGLGIKVWATFKGESEPRELTLLLAQARVRNSPLWADDPRQQLAYLAVKRWSRLYCPDVIMGVYTPDELDTQTMKDINERPGRPSTAKPSDIASKKQAQTAGPSAKLLADARSAADMGTDAFGVFWKKITPNERGALRNEVNDLRDRCETADKRTVEAEEAPPAAPVDDDFVQAMDKASGHGGDGEYIPE